jgi:hypothetical protein
MKTVNMKVAQEKTFIKMMLIILVGMVSMMSACSDDDDEPNLPAAPTLNNATNVTANSFTATWTAVNGADKYLVDVSINQNFTPLLAGYDKKEIVGAVTTPVNGLTTATKYYFRVYAKDGARVSAASAVKEVTTQ